MCSTMKVLNQYIIKEHKDKFMSNTSETRDSSVT